MEVEFIFEALLEVGLEPKDLGHLEYLNDPIVLQHLPTHQRQLQRNRREDSVLYFRAWADALEAALPLTKPATAAPTVAPQPQPSLS